MTLSSIRDLLIIIAIYLYFMAWVYLHTYYSAFGISTESLKLDYSTYLIFSYNVVHSDRFMHFAAWTIGCLVAGWIVVQALFPRLEAERQNQFTALQKPLLIAAMIILFPVLFSMSQAAALANYAIDRTTIGDRHRIEFFFRDEALKNMQHDSTSYDLQMLYSDHGRTLRLLGETDNYYIVLNQGVFDTVAKSYPEGSVYYVDKKDILLSRIILSSRK